MSNGDVALITGATSGIGRETALGLADRGFRVLVHGRDPERGRDVCEAITDETAGEASFYRADLADFDAVRDLADSVAADVDELDVLLNNAGTWQAERRLVAATGARSDGSRAGVEMTMAVNHCAHYLLTHDLWPTLAPDGRVVTVSSSVHERGHLDTDRFVGPDGPSGQASYADSKLANVAFTHALDRRSDTITATCCHPGVIPNSRLAREATGLSRLLWKGMEIVGAAIPFGPISSEREGAETSISLATRADSEDLGGAYFANSTPKDPATIEQDEREHCWSWTADVVGVDPDWPPIA